MPPPVAPLTTALIVSMSKTWLVTLLHTQPSLFKPQEMCGRRRKASCGEGNVAAILHAHREGFAHLARVQYASHPSGSINKLRLDLRLVVKLWINHEIMSPDISN
mgnify:CR=1 FL=1